MKRFYFLTIIIFLSSCIKQITDEPETYEEEIKLERVTFPEDFNFSMTKDLELHIDTKDIVNIKVLAINTQDEASEIAKVNLKTPKTFNFTLDKDIKAIVLEVKKDNQVKQYRKEVESGQLDFYL